MYLNFKLFLPQPLAIYDCTKLSQSFQSAKILSHHPITIATLWLMQCAGDQLAKHN